MMTLSSTLMFLKIVVSLERADDASAGRDVRRQIRNALALETHLARCRPQE